MNNIIAVLLALSMAASEMPQSVAFVTPISRQSISNPLQLYAQKNRDDDFTSMTDGITQQRREFILKSLGVTSIISSSFISTANAGDDDYLYKRGEGDLTTELFNEDGSLRDPNSVVSAQDKILNIPFSLPTSVNGISMNISTDGGQASPSTSDAKTTMIASYKLPVKWNQDATSQLPLYYDSSEGKNGPSCNRISIYSVSAPSNLDMKTLEKASTIGVGKSLFMDQLPNNYFDKGVLKADLISGRTVRKPIKSLEVEGGVDEQTYYEFDLAFAPLECPDFKGGNKENLGLGFCPYDNIYLVSATVLNDSEKDKSGTLMCCVVECNKDEWKMANSDIKRVRSSFTLERA